MMLPWVFFLFLLCFYMIFPWVLFLFFFLCFVLFGYHGLNAPFFLSVSFFVWLFLCFVFQLVSVVALDLFSFFLSFFLSVSLPPLFLRFLLMQDAYIDSSLLFVLHSHPPRTPPGAQRSNHHTRTAIGIGLRPARIRRRASQRHQ